MALKISIDASGVNVEDYVSRSDMKSIMRQHIINNGSEGAVKAVMPLWGNLSEKVMKEVADRVIESLVVHVLPKFNKLIEQVSEEVVEEYIETMTKEGVSDE